MGTRYVPLLLAGCLVAFPHVVSGQTPHPFASDVKEIDVGRATFRIYCSPCHGIRAQGGRGPDLRNSDFATDHSEQELYDVIANGIPGTEMPASAPPRMTSDSIWRVVAYLRSIARANPGAPRGDARAGKSVFWGKGQCGSCHRVGNRGGRLGPDLSTVGRARAVEYLREAVEAPHASITPGYASVTVVTRDGDEISGVERVFDNFSVHLMDSQETLHSFLRSEVQSVRKEQRSLMPGYSTALSDSEMENLLSYLAQLGRREDAP